MVPFEVYCHECTIERDFLLMQNMDDGLMSKNSTKKLRMAVIGVGNMGYPHANDIMAIPDAELVAICDTDRQRGDQAARALGVDVYDTHEELFAQVELDAVLVATPHYDHVPISIVAMQQGVHVLVEKPIAVHAKAARQLVEAYESARTTHPDLVFAVMFMQRTYGYWRKIKAMIDAGELGKLVRTTWIVTDWFRTQAYYDGGGWRATWRGEGGGVLLNQCPHNLDIYQWLVGMPQRVTGFASLGKYHDIEVEDEVTAYFEHANGMVGHFITTTAESPGTNRLEIVGENGKLIYEDGKITFFRNRHSMLKQVEKSPDAYEKVENWTIDVPFEPRNRGAHALITENFVRAIRGEVDLIAPAPEGYNTVLMISATMLSSFTGRAVEIPFDEAAYEAKLDELIKASRYKKPVLERPERPLKPTYG